MFQSFKFQNIHEYLSSILFNISKTLFVGIIMCCWEGGGSQPAPSELEQSTLSSVCPGLSHNGYVAPKQMVYYASKNISQVNDVQNMSNIPYCV